MAKEGVKRRRSSDSPPSGIDDKNLTSVGADRLIADAEALGADFSGVEIRPSSAVRGGLGGFAKREFAADEVVLRLPAACAIGVDDALRSPTCLAFARSLVALRESSSSSGAASSTPKDKEASCKGDAEDREALLRSFAAATGSAEVLLWFHLAHLRVTAELDSAEGGGKRARASDGQSGERADGAGPEALHALYVRSLPECAPGAAQFPGYLLDAIEGTNLRASCDAAASAIGIGGPGVVAAIRGFAPTVGADPERLVELVHWARGHYIARRFPQRVKGARTDSGFPELGGSAGVMLPCIDLLNHRHGAKVSVSSAAASAAAAASTAGSSGAPAPPQPEAIVYRSAAPVASGDELWLNYGDDSNEELLLAYGFTVSDNPDDAVAMKLGAVGPDGEPVPGGASVHWIRRRDHGSVPDSLWQAISPEGEWAGMDSEDSVQEMMALCSVLQGGLARLEDGDARAAELAKEHPGDWRWDHVDRYRSGQRAIFEEAIEDISEAIERVMPEDAFEYVDDDDDDDQEEEEE